MARTPKQTKQEPLEVVLWKAADKLRKNIDAAEYKHIVLGLIFLKYISDVWQDHYDGYKAQYGNEPELIEEELIRLVEVRPKAIVHDVDELRQWHWLGTHQATADLRRAIESTSLTFLQRD